MTLKVTCWKLNAQMLTLMVFGNEIFGKIRIIGDHENESPVKALVPLKEKVKNLSLQATVALWLLLPYQIIAQKPPPTYLLQPRHSRL